MSYRAIYAYAWDLAEGSLAELDTQVRLSVALGFCRENNSERISTLITDLQKMLNGLRRKLSTNH